MIKTLITVVGPTGIGKTSLSIALAKHFNTDVLSADSRQFFWEIPIGTAAPSAEELKNITHHCIHHKSITEPYNVGDFEKDALQLLDACFKTKDVMIMVGGSGLYIDAVTKGLDTFPEVDPSIRERLNKRVKTEGLTALQEQLKHLDPTSYHTIDLDNPQRVIRALEICIGTGKPFSSFLNKPKEQRPFNTLFIGLDGERDAIYQRINLRVDKMIKEGLIDEAKSVYHLKHLNALNTVGYKELFRYFDGEWDLDVAISEIKKNSRRYAKRQFTWFRKNEVIHWFDFSTDYSEIIEFVELKLEG